MKQDIRKIVSDLKKSFVHSSKYIQKDSNDIYRQLRERIAEINCRRILLMLPLFLGIGIYNLVRLSRAEQNDLFWAAVGADIFLIVIALAFSACILWVLYGNNIENSREIWKCKVMYRLYWWFWLVAMLVINYYFVNEGKEYGFFVLIWAVICLVPLHGVKEFCAMLAGTIVFFFLVTGRIPQTPENLRDLQLLQYTSVVILIVGFIAQQFEVGLWTLQEYVKLKAFFDPLTGLLNRRGGDAYFEDAAKKWDEAAGDKPFGVIMLDIDFFKKYNDTFGHDEGDRCLAMVSRCIQKTTKGRTKLAIRHGGEEFVVLLAKSDEQETREMAEAIRMAVLRKGLKAPVPDVADVVTVSVGAALERPASDGSYESMLAAADAALYEAKNAGRNRVVFHVSQVGDQTKAES